MYTIKDLYDLDHTLAKDYLLQFTYPWEALKGIKDMNCDRIPLRLSRRSLHHRSRDRGQTRRVHQRLGARRRKLRRRQLRGA